VKGREGKSEHEEVGETDEGKGKWETGEKRE
jgi:hypothetical protein